jgi:hypothetical protein
MRAWSPLSFLVISVLCTAPVQAEEDRVRAREAYDLGVAAYALGEYPTAAKSFAEADALAPSVVALEQALKAAAKADDSALVMELVERAQLRPPDRRIHGMAKQLAREHQARVGRLQLECPRGSGCWAQVENRRIRPGQSLWLKEGQAEVTIHSSQGEEKRTINVPGGQVMHVAPAERPRPNLAPSTPAPPVLGTTSSPSRSSGGISRGWFFGGLGATAVVCGVAGWSAWDTAKKHRQFVATGTSEDRQLGLAAQRRTNILWGSAALVGVTTLVLGGLFVDWSGVPARPSVSAGPNGATLSFGGAL